MAAGSGEVAPASDRGQRTEGLSDPGRAGLVLLCWPRAGGRGTKGTDTTGQGHGVGTLTRGGKGHQIPGMTLPREGGTGPRSGTGSSGRTGTGPGRSRGRRYRAGGRHWSWGVDTGPGRLYLAEGERFAGSGGRHRPAGGRSRAGGGAVRSCPAPAPPEPPQRGGCPCPSPPLSASRSSLGAGGRDWLLRPKPAPDSPDGG